MESTATDSVIDAQPVYAGFWIRMGAYALDYMVGVVLGIVIAFLLMLPLGILLGILGRTLPEGFGSLVGALIGLPIAWAYYALFESSKYQGTPGKLALGLRVTDEAGNRISVGRATGRYFSKFLSALLLCIGYVMIGTSARKQGLHDRIAHTLVLRKTGESPTGGRAVDGGDAIR